VADEGDDAQMISERERESILRRHRARPRFDGVAVTDCRGCGDPIPPARQAAVPGTRFCAECKGTLEGSRR